MFLFFCNVSLGLGLGLGLHSRATCYILLVLIMAGVNIQRVIMLGFYLIRVEVLL